MAGRDGHGVDVRVVRVGGVGVMVEDLDLIDLAQQALIDGLHVPARQRLGLRLG